MMMSLVAAKDGGPVVSVLAIAAVVLTNGVIVSPPKGTHTAPTARGTPSRSSVAPPGHAGGEKNKRQEAKYKLFCLATCDVRDIIYTHDTRYNTRYNTWHPIKHHELFE